jgi:hypothetical protein
MTRFEKIQKMQTADKLADWLMQYMDCDACPVMDCKSFKYCKRNLTKLLNSEEPKMCASCAINFGDGERTENGKND